MSAPRTIEAVQPSPAPTDETTEAARARRVGIAGLAGLITGSFLSSFGFAFDIQWHIDVGPDTFFTLSHLMVYAGSAISGLSALAMVLIATAGQRRGHPFPRAFGGAPVRVFGGVFTAPLGYLVAGVGSALFLGYGVVDLNWHSVYGFDAVLNSPPHIALFLSISVSMIGSIIAAVAARRTGWGQLAAALSFPVLMTFAPLTSQAFRSLALPFPPEIAGSVLVDAILLSVAVATIPRAWFGTVVALALGAMQAAMWAFAPWAAHNYAAASGLPLRDELASHAPLLPSYLPMFLIVAAVACDLLVMAVRRGKLGSRIALLTAGSVTGIVVALSLPLQQLVWDSTQTVSTAALLALGLVGLVFGAIGGLLASPITVMLTETQPQPYHSIELAPADRTN